MVINEQTQLGLNFLKGNDNIIIDIFKYIESEKHVQIYKKLESGLHELVGNHDAETLSKLENDANYMMSYQKGDVWIKNIYPLMSIVSSNLVDKNNQQIKKPFLICDNVFHVSEMIKIPENIKEFDITIFEKIKDGIYTYLMGKDKFCRLIIENGNIQGFIYDESNKYCFILNINQKHNLIDWSGNKLISNVEMYSLLKLIIFIELGDITIEEIAAGRDNNKTRNEGKVKNGSKLDVQIIDSKWNTISIRTEGFPVRGHFRIQPFGKDMKDKKLIWIKAFEKLGYIRNGNKLNTENS